MLLLATALLLLPLMSAARPWNARSELPYCALPAIRLDQFKEVAEAACRGFFLQTNITRASGLSAHVWANYEPETGNDEYVVVKFFVKGPLFRMNVDSCRAVFGVQDGFYGLQDQVKKFQDLAASAGSQNTGTGGVCRSSVSGIDGEMVQRWYFVNDGGIYTAKVLPFTKKIPWYSRTLVGHRNKSRLLGFFLFNMTKEFSLDYSSKLSNLYLDMTSSCR